MDHEIFLPRDKDINTKKNKANEEIARKVCAGCDERQPCLEAGIGAPGVWGGLPEAERRPKLKRRGNSPPGWKPDLPDIDRVLGFK